MKSKASLSSEMTKNHNFEVVQSSGLIVFTIDSCQPVELKFSEKIKVAIILDPPLSNSSYINPVNEQMCENISEWQSQQSDDTSTSKLSVEGVSVIDTDCRNVSSETIISENGGCVHTNMMSESSPGKEKICENIKKSHELVNLQDESTRAYTDEECRIDHHFESASGGKLDINEKQILKSGTELGIRETRGYQREKKVFETGKEHDKDGNSKMLDSHYETTESLDTLKNSQTKRRLRSFSKLENENKKVKLTPSTIKQRKAAASHKAFINKVGKIAINSNQRLTKEKIAFKWKRKSPGVVEQANQDNKLKVKKDSGDIDLKRNKQAEGDDSYSDSDTNENVLDYSINQKYNNQTTKHKQAMSSSRPRKLLVEKDVECKYCEVTFKTKLDFFDHRRTEGSSHSCKQCGKKEPFEALLMVHMQTHKPHKGQLVVDDEQGGKKCKTMRKRFKMKCEVCGLVVSSLDSLRIHAFSHTGECPYKCCVCNDRFFSLTSLQHHLETHLSADRIRCMRCDMRFSSRAKLARHQLTHEIKCDLCGEVFPNKTSRNFHYRTVHQSDCLKCTLCSNLFGSETDLQRHMIYHNKAGKKEQCPECGVVVVRLKSHMALHTRKECDGELFTCTHCSKGYLRKSSLDKHLLTHTGERPYACNKCAKSFTTHGMLRRHLLTHSSERKYACNICGKRCSVRSNLAVHMKRHTDLRPHSCSFCPQAFNYKNSLKIHIKSKHKQLQETSHLQFSCLHCPQAFQDNAQLASHVLVNHSHAADTNAHDARRAGMKGAKLDAEVSDTPLVSCPAVCHQNPTQIEPESTTVPYLTDHSMPAQTYPVVPLASNSHHSLSSTPHTQEDCSLTALQHPLMNMQSSGRSFFDDLIALSSGPLKGSLSTTSGPFTSGPLSGVSLTSGHSTDIALSCGPSTNGPVIGVPLFNSPLIKSPSSNGPTIVGPLPCGLLSDGSLSTTRPSTLGPISNCALNIGPTSSGPIISSSSTSGSLSSHPLISGSLNSGPLSSGPLVSGSSTSDPVSSHPLMSGSLDGGLLSSGPLVRSPSTSGLLSSHPLISSSSSSGPLSSHPLISSSLSNGPLVNGPSTTGPLSSGPSTSWPLISGSSTTSGPLSSGLLIRGSLNRSSYTLSSGSLVNHSSNSDPLSSGPLMSGLYSSDPLSHDRLIGTPLISYTSLSFSSPPTSVLSNNGPLISGLSNCSVPPSRSNYSNDYSTNPPFYRSSFSNAPMLSSLLATGPTTCGLPSSGPVMRNPTYSGPYNFTASPPNLEPTGHPEILTNMASVSAPHALPVPVTSIHHLPNSMDVNVQHPRSDSSFGHSPSCSPNSHPSPPPPHLSSRRLIETDVDTCIPSETNTIQKPSQI